jgi:hypothetical protein
MNQQRFQHLVSHRILLLLAALLPFAVGCGEKSGRMAIHGRIQFDGQPMETGTIRFLPIEGAKGTITGGGITNGQYQISQAEGPMPGMHRVEIRSPKKGGRRTPKPFSTTGEMIETMIEAVAPRFNDESTLKCEVKPGNNTADFEVNSK